MKAITHVTRALLVASALMRHTAKSAADVPAPSKSATVMSVAEIAEGIQAHSPAIKAVEMRGYTNQIPGTRASYAMVVIPGGEFAMGSAEGSRFSKPEEEPRHRIRLEPFWMGRCEVTWSEYDAFVNDDLEGRQAMQHVAETDRQVDAVTHPTLPYVDPANGMGKTDRPAIAMTQHAANQYCQWLSAKTGHFYRLPTEAEWEYAARAGTTNTWFFGEEEGKLTDYAWYEANSAEAYHKVGGKLPNPWGLYDMLGNVSEWALDQNDAEYYATCARQGTVTMPWNKATQPYPHVVRGGSWKDAAEFVRCAARGRSEPTWKAGDPQAPTSLFWFRSCDFVGFRIVRPLAVPTTEEMRKYWVSGVQRD